MITPLLQTKLHIPPIRSEVVRRSRLIDLVASRPQLKLALIAAPAGFGKTTLASSWLTGSAKRVAWVSLDEGDNDLKRFLLYVITALQQAAGDVCSTALEMLGRDEPLSPTAVLAYLINDLDCTGTPLTLALDDYHQIHAPEVHDALAFLMDNLPPQLQIVLLSRTEPPLPLARLRSRHEMVELSAADLRFTWDEAETFLNRTMRLGLSGEQITELETRTEGWITGLQLIALSIRNAEDANRLIQEISGDDRYIADYLIDEVLSRQPAHIQQFLLQTSLLARMSAPLCDAVLGIGDSRRTLETLQKSNLFVIPLDNTRTWFRYHHLFAELLQRRFAALHGAHPAPLHRRAAQWFFAHHMTEEAIDHSLDAGDYAAVTGYLQGVIDDEFLAKGRFKVYLDWLDRIPDEHLRAHPRLILYRVFQLWEMQQLAKFHQQLALIEQMLGPIPGDPAELDAQSAAQFGILCIIKGVMNCGDFCIEDAASYFSHALRLLPESARFWRSLALGASGFCLRMRGRYTDAEKCFAPVTDFAVGAGLTWLAFQYGVARAQVCLALGKLETAIRTCRALLALDAQHGHQLPFAGAAYATMGELLYLTGDLDAAERHTRRGLELIAADGDARHVADSAFTLARIQIARGESSRAMAVAERTIHDLHGMAAPESVLAIARAYQAHIWLTGGEPARAGRWAADPGDARLSGDHSADIMGLPYFGVYCTIYEPVAQSVKFIRLTAARCALAAGRADAAVEIADRLLAGGLYGDEIYLQAQVLIVKALALQAAEQADRAVEAAIAAIRLLAPERFTLLFAGEGRPMRQLLAGVQEALTRRATVGAEGARVWEAAEQMLAQMPQQQESPPRPDAPPVSELSARETEVLRALARGISYGEMTEELQISRNTVKTYLKRIYSKLDAANRLQAVNKAKELGLLP